MEHKSIEAIPKSAAELTTVIVMLTFWSTSPTNFHVGMPPNIAFFQKFVSEQRPRKACDQHKVFRPYDLS